MAGQKACLPKKKAAFSQGKAAFLARNSKGEHKVRPYGQMI